MEHSFNNRHRHSQYLLWLVAVVGHWGSVDNSSLTNGRMLSVVGDKRLDICKVPICDFYRNRETERLLMSM